jgi:hypothetical protein
MRTSLGLMIGVALGVALPNPGWAQASSPPAATQTASAVPVYVPPMRGAPEARISGGTRGKTDVPVKLDVIAPNDIGETVKDQPTLYWFNSLPIKNDVDITIVTDDSNMTVLEQMVHGPFVAGIHGFRLEGTKVRLDPQKVYQWSVTVKISASEPSQDIVASGMVQVVAPPKPTVAIATDAVATVDFYARSGIWYDAIDTLSRQIDQNPADGTLRFYRDALMMQVGLNDVAAFDNNAAAGAEDKAKN